MTARIDLLKEVLHAEERQIVASEVDIRFIKNILKTKMLTLKPQEENFYRQQLAVKEQSIPNIKEVIVIIEEMIKEEEEKN